MELSSVLVAGVVYGLTELVKLAKAIPVQEGQVGRIRMVAGVLSFLGALGVAFANGSIESVLSPELLDVVGNAVVTFALTWVGHKSRNIITQ